MLILDYKEIKQQSLLEHDISDKKHQINTLSLSDLHPLNTSSNP
jgi:hypothetical protein